MESNTFSGEEGTPKVFVSYSYDSVDHEEWVENLVDRLRENMIDATLDKYELNDSNDLNEIMIKNFRDSDKVIIIGTKKYAEKAKNIESGVGYEMKLATIIDRDPALKNKLIFVKKDIESSYDDALPFQFKGSFMIDFSKNKEFEIKFALLRDKICNKNTHKKPPLGKSDLQISTGTYEINNKTIYSIFERTGFEPFNLSEDNLLHESVIIWPIVPRPNINLIHKSQVEVVRILSLLNWDIKIIIANCGEQTSNTPSKQDLDFKNNLELMLQKCKISKFEIKFLNDYFSPIFDDGKKILSNFIKLSSSLKINQLTKFNTKDEGYSQIVQNKINERSTLKYISPLLTWSASIYEAEKMLEINNSCKPVVVAGRDEETQWSHVFREINSKMGAVFIPVLKDEDGSTFFQEGGRLLFSKKQLAEKLNYGNIDKWLTQSFIFLAKYPSIVNKLDICDTKDCDKNESCFECMFPKGSDKLPSHINKDKFVDLIFPQINPSL